MAQPADLAVLGLVIDASGAIKGIQAAEGKLVSLEQSFGKVQKAAAVAFGAGLGLALGAFVKNTIDAEREVAMLESRIKSTGGVAGFTAQQLVRIGGELQRVSTFSGGAIAGMQELLLTFTNVRGDNFTSASKAILDMATVMKGDLKGAAIQVGKALNDPVLGATALTKVGVLLSESQKETIKQMVALNDIAGAQSIILKELATEFGGAAEAARNTLGGALTGLKEAFGDLFESPDSVEGMAEAINGLTDNLKTATRMAVVLGATIATALFGGAVAGAFASITAALKALNVSIGITTVAAQGLKMVMTTMGGQWVVGITAAVLALGSAWVYFAGKADEAKDAADDLKKSLDELSYKGIEQKFAEKIKEIENATRQLQQLGGAGSTIAVENKRKEINALEDEARAITKVLQERQKLIRGGAGVALPSVAVVFDPEAEAKAKEARDKETKRIDDYLDKLRSQIAELNKLREEFAVRSAAAMDMSGAGTADLKQQIKERDEYTDAVEKGANTELRLLIALTQAREEYRRALDAGQTAIPLMAGPEATTQVVIEPAVASLSKFQEFFEQLRIGAQLVGENMGDAFMETFSNIAARGKVTFGDLFATASGILKSIGGKAAAFASGPLAIAAVGASILGDIISRGKAERKAAIDALKADMDAFTDAITGFAESFRVRGSQFAEDTRRNTEFAEKQRKEIAELDNVLTRTAFRLLQATGGDVDAAIRRRTEQLQRDRPFADPFDDVAVKQLMQYKEQMEQLTQVTKEATAAAEDARRVREQERNDDLDVRRLQAIGRDEEADALRLQIAQDKERRQAERDLSEGEITRDTFDKLIEVLRLEQQAQTGATQTTSGPIQSLAAAQVQDIDRVVGELTTIRVRSGQVVSLLTQLVRGGGIIGAVNNGLQSTTSRTQVILGNTVVS